MRQRSQVLLAQGHSASSALQTAKCQIPGIIPGMGEVGICNVLIQL